MPTCDASSERPYMTALLFLNLALGAVIPGVIAVWFSAKWNRQVANKDGTDHTLPRITAAVLSSLVTERLGRLIAFILRYGRHSLAASVFYHSNNILTSLGIYGLLLTLMIFRLDATFKGTIYSPPALQIRVLYSLTVCCIGTLLLFLGFNTLPPNRTSVFLKLVTFSFLFATLVLSLTILFRVNMAFTSRLRAIVIASSAQRMNPSQIEKVNSLSKENTATQTDSVITRIKSATLSSYGPSQKQVLKTVAKSTLLAYWISLSVMILLVCGTLFIFGRCARNWASIIGHGLMTVAFLFIGLSISFNLKFTQPEYQYCCSVLDSYLQKWVAYQTDHLTLATLTTITRDST